MTINTLRDAFLRLYQQTKGPLEPDALLLLTEMPGHQFVPWITRTQPTFDDEDVITLEGARDLWRWYEVSPSRR